MTGPSDPGVTILQRRLAAARELVEVGGDRLPDEMRARLDQVVTRSSRRLEVAGDHTVAVMAGPTGVGKSSLFNAVLDVDLAVPGVRRPTTSEPVAGVVSSDPVGELMGHIGLGTWHHVAVSSQPLLESLVLVDLPDHDSVVTANRARAAEVVAVADRLLWVVDPEKYADASVHDDLLEPLREHAGLLTVVVNRIDRVAEQQRSHLLGDLRRLLHRSGLGAVQVVATSTVTGVGIDDVRDLLTRSITNHRAANERIAADLRALGKDLDVHVPPAGRMPAIVEDVVPAALQAAGVPAVVAAVVSTHRHRARRATGWPVVRRFQARGRDPLARLGLRRDRATDGVGSRSSRPLPHGVATATLATVVREHVDGVTTDWPDAWAVPVERRLDDVVEHLPVRLDRAVVAADLDDDRMPAWWMAVNVVQWLVASAMLGGALWLLAAFVVAWLQLPDLPMPGWEGIPYPTIMVVGGIVGGLALGAIANQAARVGAARAGRRVRQRLAQRVADVVEDTVAEALAAEASSATQAREALDLLSGS